MAKENNPVTVYLSDEQKQEIEQLYSGVEEMDGAFELSKSQLLRFLIGKSLDGIRDGEIQLDDIDVSPGDIELEETDDGRFEGVFEREVRR